MIWYDKDGKVTKEKDWTPKSVWSLRTMMGHTQRSFAQIIGVRYATIANWETGVNLNGPSRMARAKLEETLRNFEKLEK